MGIAKLLTSLHIPSCISSSLINFIFSFYYSFLSQIHATNLYEKFSLDPTKLFPFLFIFNSTASIIEEKNKKIDHKMMNMTLWAMSKRGRNKPKRKKKDKMINDCASDDFDKWVLRIIFMCHIGMVLRWREMKEDKGHAAQDGVLMFP